MSVKSPEKTRGKKSLVGFAAARSGEAFVIHIVDDAAEVFEIEASRENVESIVADLQKLIADAQPTVAASPNLDANDATA